MTIFKHIIMLLTISVCGVMYYFLSVSKFKQKRKLAFMLKIALLVLSLVLAFFEQEFIVIGNLAFGGRISVSILILIEIIDACIDQRKE